MAETSPRVVAGRYEVIRPLGRGAFGHTMLATDRETGLSVALKWLDPREAGDRKAAELFEREAAVLRSLRHQCIPEVFDLVRDEWDGAPAWFLVMAFVDGTPLSQVIDERRPLDGPTVMRLFVEMLGILEYLHGRVPQILHRDIKPSNIIVREDGLPALVDFGSVRRDFRAADEAGSTIAGTYGYMPYEQYMGQATAASDLYALGATFLHVLTGRPPRDFMTDEGRIAVPDPLPGDPRLRAVIARLLRPSPTERFASAREARDALLSSAPPAPLAMARVGSDVPVAIAEMFPPLAERPTRPAGAAAQLFEDVTPSALDLMAAAEKKEEGTWLDWVALAFFTTVTAGVLPLVFTGMARQKRRRMLRFFAEGMPAVAEIQAIEIEKMAFQIPTAKVRYEFEADGRVHRDADHVLPMVANRWRVGDRIDVLFDRARGYDSAIISGFPRS